MGKFGVAGVPDLYKRLVASEIATMEAVNSIYDDISDEFSPGNFTGGATGNIKHEPTHANTGLKSINFALNDIDGAKIADSAITAAKIKNSSISGEHIAEGGLTHGTLKIDAPGGSTASDVVETISTHNDSNLTTKDKLLCMGVKELDLTRTWGTSHIDPVSVTGTIKFADDEEDGGNLLGGEIYDGVHSLTSLYPMCSLSVGWSGDGDEYSPSGDFSHAAQRGVWFSTPLLYDFNIDGDEAQFEYLFWYVSQSPDGGKNPPNKLYLHWLWSILRSLS